MVLREVTRGSSNEEIAEALHLSVATVKTHINHMMQKTGFRNRTELAIEARVSGIVIP
jgi:two-component system vancomycin resistance associated response regulator VraR